MNGLEAVNWLLGHPEDFGHLIRIVEDETGDPELTRLQKRSVNDYMIGVKGQRSIEAVAEHLVRTQPAAVGEHIRRWNAHNTN